MVLFMLSLIFPRRRVFFGETFKLHNWPPVGWVFYFYHQVQASSRDRADTWADTSLNLNLRIIFPYKSRVLIFTNSNLDQAQLKAQEEERQKREAEEKEAQLEKKREEKRLKKMVSSVCLVNCLSLEAYCVQCWDPVHFPHLRTSV